MTIRTRYLTLTAFSFIAAASVLLSGAFVSGFVFSELQMVLRFSLLLPFVASLWLMWTALRFFRKANAEAETEQDSVEGSVRCADNVELQYVNE